MSCSGERLGRLLIGGELVPGRLSWANGRITKAELEPLEASSCEEIIAPGLIDLHVHGFGGADPLEDLPGMAAALARAGTTAFQPTLFPRAPRRLGSEAEGVWRAAAQLVGEPMARVVGLHLEGPFVNPRAAGALPVEDLAEPSPEALRELLGPSDGDGHGVRTMTLAPELPGAAALSAELVRCGVRVSLGHSRASCEQARAAARAGAVGATHLFNAMRGFHHREAGLAGFCLSQDALHAELVCDLVHVSREGIELALAARGPEGLCLVSDALLGAGTGCEVFHWHGRDHLVRDGAAWYPPLDPEGAEPQLAGSSTGQLEALRRLVVAGVVGLAEGLRMAAETPARALGMEHELGRLLPGAHADLIVLRGPQLELVEVLVGGERASGIALQP